MASDGEKGNFSADIPASILEEALRSVERHGPGEDPPEGPSAPEEKATPAESSLEAQLALSQEKGRETLERLKEEHERYLRAVADLDNYKKRVAREKEDLQKFAAERIVKDVLPGIDNLERALAAAAADDPLSGGVRMVLKQFEEALARHGVKAQSALHQPFDPRFHEALSSVEGSGHPPGTVIAEHGRAWLIHGRLLRPAMVAVAAGGREPPASAPEGAPG
ncbi:MAG TPA: nucleotide exchange factor GrpE [Anaeromyxobacteraceae bacterium]|nr:nucleotide exchange factor GrpE [Anaeromyxobacteraceae bacterium]